MESRSFMDSSMLAHQRGVAGLHAHLRREGPHRRARAHPARAMSRWRSPQPRRGGALTRTRSTVHEGPDRVAPSTRTPT